MRKTLVGLVGLVAMILFVSLGVAACQDLPTREAQALDLPSSEG